jgi:hypothetical protein
MAGQAGEWTHGFILGIKIDAGATAVAVEKPKTTCS